MPLKSTVIFSKFYCNTQYIWLGISGKHTGHNVLKLTWTGSRTGSGSIEMLVALLIINQ